MPLSKETLREVGGSYLANVLSQLGFPGIERWWRAQKGEAVQPETRHAVSVIMELFPTMEPWEVPDDWLEKSKRYARSGGGLPGERHIVNDNSISEERKNELLRDFHAERFSAPNRQRRKERLDWHERLSNHQRRQVELLPKDALKRLFTEERVEERNSILASVADRTFLQGVGVALDRAPQLQQEAEESLQRVYQRLDPENLSFVDELHNWAEQRSRQFTREDAPVGTLPKWIVFVPAGIGAAIILAIIVWHVAKFLPYVGIAAIILIAVLLAIRFVKNRRRRA